MYGVRVTNLKLPSLTTLGKETGTGNTIRIQKFAGSLSSEQMAGSSRTEKTRSDENASRSIRKRRSMASDDISTEDVDSEGLASGEVRSGALEASPTPARRAKQKSLDHSLGGSTKERARLIDSQIRRLRQSPSRSANHGQPDRAPSSTKGSSTPPIAVPSSYGPDAVVEERSRKTPILEPNKAFYIEELTQSPSDRNPSTADTVERSSSPLLEIDDTMQLPVQDENGELVFIQTADDITDPNGAFYIAERSQSPLGRNSEAIDTNQEIRQVDEDETAHEITTKISITATAADTKKPKRKLQKKASKETSSLQQTHNQ